jgi:hypothetical protein
MAAQVAFTALGAAFLRATHLCRCGCVAYRGARRAVADIFPPRRVRGAGPDVRVYLRGG